MDRTDDVIYATAAALGNDAAQHVAALIRQAIAEERQRIIAALHEASAAYCRPLEGSAVVGYIEGPGVALCEIAKALEGLDSETRT